MLRSFFFKCHLCLLCLFPRLQLLQISILHKCIYLFTFTEKNMSKNSNILLNEHIWTRVSGSSDLHVCGLSWRKSPWPCEEHENSILAHIQSSCCEVTVQTTEPMCHLYLLYNVMKLLWLTKASPSVAANMTIRLQGGRMKMKLGSVDRWMLCMQAEALSCMSFKST